MLSAIALSFAASALAAPAPNGAPLTVSLERTTKYQARADGSVDGPAFLSTLNSTLHKYKGQSLPTFSGVSRLLEARATASEPLTDQVEQGQDELYYGNADVSGQTFTVDFDTGSADFFVPGPKCSTAQGCVGTTKYDQSGTDEKNTTSVTYGSGSVSGENCMYFLTYYRHTRTHARHQTLIRCLSLVLRQITPMSYPSLQPKASQAAHQIH